MLVVGRNRLIESYVHLSSACVVITLASRFFRNNRDDLNTATGNEADTALSILPVFAALLFPGKAARCTSQKLHERLARSRDASRDNQRRLWFICKSDDAY